MKDLNELVGKLSMVVQEEDKGSAFKKTIREIADFYKENLQLLDEEIAIFLTNDEKTILSFAYPEYLVDAGMIPIGSSEATAASIFRRGIGVIENNFQQQRHLSIFEIIRTPDGKLKPLWKMMGTLIAAEGEKIGVVEISRRGENQLEAGEDFSEEDLQFLMATITKFAPYIKMVLPENFRGRIT
ncbi:MAG: GAF domain-containing protein [Candidatus Aminicenantes bacterium]|nr:GAF domain-containing protein [Candidatus Aminicenantes bacterium]